jgi:hypothetical protein
MRFVSRSQGERTRETYLSDRAVTDDDALDGLHSWCSKGDLD